jgi:hypothetical protein
MTDPRAIDEPTAKHLLTTLRGTTWGWTGAELPRIVDALGWTGFKELEGRAAFANAPWDLGGREVQVFMQGDAVNRITQTVTERRTRKTDESLAFMDRYWRQLVALATELFGAPTTPARADDPDAQWRGDRTTIGIKNAQSGVIVSWATNEYQDEWNKLKRPG